MTTLVEDGKRLRLVPSEDLVSSISKKYGEEWKEALDANGGVEYVEVDMSGVEFLDSSGIGLLIGIYKECVKERKVEFELVNCNEFVGRVIKAVKLDKIFNI